MQILVTSDQRRRLERESNERGISMGELIRKAIDAHYPAGPTREERMRAVEELVAMRVPGPAPSPEEINRLVAEEREENLRKLGLWPS
jgi:hypothetical protein